MRRGSWLTAGTLALRGRSRTRAVTPDGHEERRASGSSGLAAPATAQRLERQSCCRRSRDRFGACSFRTFSQRPERRSDRSVSDARRARLWRGAGQVRSEPRDVSPKEARPRVVRPPALARTRDEKQGARPDGRPVGRFDDVPSCEIGDEQGGLRTGVSAPLIAGSRADTPVCNNGGLPMQSRFGRSPTEVLLATFEALGLRRSECCQGGCERAAGGRARIARCARRRFDRSPRFKRRERARREAPPRECAREVGQQPAGEETPSKGPSKRSLYS